MQWERPDAARKAQWNSENKMCDGRGLRLRGLPIWTALLSLLWGKSRRDCSRRENAKKFQDAITSIL